MSFFVLKVEELVYIGHVAGAGFLLLVEQLSCVEFKALENGFCKSRESPTLVWLLSLANLVLLFLNLLSWT